MKRNNPVSVNIVGNVGPVTLGQIGPHAQVGNVFAQISSSTFKIFINYRRDDSRWAAGRLRDAIAERYGSDSVFLDTESLHVGSDFREELKRTIAEASLVISVVGPRWAKAFEDARGVPDYVAFELEAAFMLNKVIVPILLDDTVMPDAASLPKPLEWFAFRNAVRIRGDHFNGDCGSLCSRIAELMDSQRRSIGTE